jgi:hypothetical protein
VNALTIIAALTLLLAFLVIVTVRLDSRRHQMSAYLQRWLSQGRTLVVLGGAGWLLCLVIFANRLRGAAGVGMSELVLVGFVTFALLALGALALLGAWWFERRARRRGAAPPT